MKETPTGSSSAPRSRLSRPSSSREVSQEDEEEQEEVPEVHPEHDNDAQDAQEGGYPGVSSDMSVLIYYHDHAARHIWDDEVEWVNDVVAGSGLGGLCCTKYITISHGMQGAFFERCDMETLSFHFPIGELTTTLHDVAFLLHLPIRGRLTNGAHVRFSTLKEIYEHHLVAAAGAEDEEDEGFVEYHRACALRIGSCSWLTHPSLWTKMQPTWT
ncbi:protein MAIN-LIKE 2-like [Vicia villosa]|uniref:protein MAIN-LIKE 2-like n=1 Tax=Vicia villosa TaxID=3911 RepID=UPI00273BE5C5|nr:protein MAIN-LIKE 2-like [Vicia villosa]